jgi:hypothetical protein
MLLITLMAQPAFCGLVNIKEIKSVKLFIPRLAMALRVQALEKSV